MKRIAILAGAAALSFGQPLAAQDAEPGDGTAGMGALANVFGDAFKAEPLTAEQEMRLPQAEIIVDKVFPSGSFARMMEDTLEPMMDSILASVGELPLGQIAALAGRDADSVAEMGDARLGEVMAILDPAYQERNKIVSKITVDMTLELMAKIEPSYRAGLTRAYAVRFTQEEMAELNRFFETPVGSHYASESMMIYADPQVMSAMNEMMPAMMELLPGMMERMQQGMASLPPPRAVGDLSAEQQQELANLLGVSREELGENAAAAEAAETGEDELNF